MNQFGIDINPNFNELKRVREICVELINVCINTYSKLDRLGVIGLVFHGLILLALLYSMVQLNDNFM